MPIFIVTLLLQVALVVHIVKTGQSTMWIWIVIMLPLAGSIAYLILVVLPQITGSKTGRKAAKTLQKAVNPHKDLQNAMLNYSMSDSIENSMKLAEAFHRENRFEEAAKLFERCLTGVHIHDPYIMQGLAKTQFELKNYERTKSILNDLIEQNPEFKSADAHLLYARTLEALGDREAAVHEYEALHGYYPGPEATYRYAIFNRNIGNRTKSQALLKDIIHRAEVSTAHYRALHNEWIQKANMEYRS